MFHDSLRRLQQWSLYTRCFHYAGSLTVQHHILTYEKIQNFIFYFKYAQSLGKFNTISNSSTFV